nr:hypothetical protein [Tanacetum cinerariifolium]
RHFSGGSVAPELLARLLEAAHQAPSVGLMQPWRFIRITDRQLRSRIQTQVEQERIRTAEALGERSDDFMRLKEFYPAPMLVLEGWAQARPLQDLVYENKWGVSP